MSQQTPPQPPVLPANGELVYPGDKLCLAADHLQLGDNVHRIDQYLFASVLGAVHCENIADDAAAVVTTPTQPQRISITPFKDQLNLPATGDYVICRVTELGQRQIFVSIEFIDGQAEPCSQCRGVIRIRDVRQLDADGVIIYESFRPGDIIRAQVISLGDARSYYLTTAKLNLGVIYCENIDGVPMELIPPNPEFKTTALVHYMKCPVTGSLQPRKAALQ